MKTTLNLTINDANKVVDALRKVAHENYDYDEEIAEGMLEEYARVFDKGLQALGIQVEISVENA